MKKFLLFALVLVMALAIVACGPSGNETTAPAGDNPPVVDDNPSSHVHAYVEAVTLEPTCTSLGKKVMKCECGEVEEGSEMPVPFAMHDAKDATCTEDSVCATCGKLLVEKYGHLYVDSVVTAASCTVEGLASFSKKCILYGSEGNVKVFSSEFACNDVDEQLDMVSTNPKAKVQTVFVIKSH